MEPTPRPLGGPPSAVVAVAVDVRGVRDNALALSRLLVSADLACRVSTVLCGREARLAVVSERAGGRAVRDAEAGFLELPPIPAASLSEARHVLGERIDLLVAPGPRTDAPAPVESAASLDVGDSGLGGRATTAAGIDAAVLRLALLHFRPPEVAALSAARLHRADETLQRWRFKVALWHDTDPAPMPDAFAGAVEAALQDRLDTPEVLLRMHRLEIDLHLPSGSKFAAFMHADRVLGLDLGHLIGKLRR